VFDRYDIPKSLKCVTRQKHLGDSYSVAYHITDTTNITNVPLRKLLSRSATKDELSAYLASRVLLYAKERHKSFVVAWRNIAEGSHRDASNVSSNQKEADTKLILHALDATKCGATVLQIISLATDVLILLDVSKNSQMKQHS